MRWPPSHLPFLLGWSQNVSRFRYMDGSSEVQAPSVVRSRQGGWWWFEDSFCGGKKQVRPGKSMNHLWGYFLKQQTYFWSQHWWTPWPLSFAPNRCHQHLICFEFLFGLCSFVFFLDAKCYDISKLYPWGLQNTPKHIKARKELFVRGLQKNRREHAMGFGRTCYLVFRHEEKIRGNANDSVFFNGGFRAWKLYLTARAWKAVFLSWRKTIIYTPK